MAVLALEDAAREAANTIFFSLRRHRIELITGEAGENVFGEGLKAALAEIDRLEQSYLELFLGKRVVTTETRRYVVYPQSDKKQYIVCRFSAAAGLLPESDLSGDMVLLQIEPSGNTATAVEASAKESNTVACRVADPSVCTVIAGGREYARAVLPCSSSAARSTSRFPAANSFLPMDYTSRMVALLRELRRERNGAVADSMRYYGTPYGLNYGGEPAHIAPDSACGGARPRFRPLPLPAGCPRTAPCRVAYCMSGVPYAGGVPAWAAGIVNSEIAEEAAFALLSRAEAFPALFSAWIASPDALLQYAAPARRRAESPPYGLMGCTGRRSRAPQCNGRGDGRSAGRSDDRGDRRRNFRRCGYLCCAGCLCR